ncbi:RagB/SusD family nutrient uptake outer membrane protein [Dyadobacter sp. LHD-138]|uniref:RagB/SusD family nutrient uptake outer membrane protein n=1 Tax=Dyadobacter sp. LHD-138 TaxID=3071413 RepID=UPI0027DF406D|nr:RagB/SusD family nutrient uptake outer membrane protein [Dyadobacter sp. LHD-138]MDQ6481093.1 RagB/SusD family nutrient uptake outer membrane protein [Dyadobacter sp. LHD-138]
MKTKLLHILSALLFGTLMNSCNDKRLDIKPLDILSNEQVFQSEAAITAYMASLYTAMPMEDFNFGGFASNTDEAGIGMTLANSVRGGTSTQWWGYGNVRNVNNLLENLPAAKIGETLKKTLTGEAKFIRAYYYLAMVKRYGGIPIIKEVQNYTGDNISELQVSRNTEKEVYDFIAGDLDEAASLLPETNAKGRVGKYAALALKSRAMLYAASSAKYGHVLLNGVLGIPAADAPKYWQVSMDAARAVIASNKYVLYDKVPNKQTNFEQLFLDRDNPESILSRFFSYPDKTHNYDRNVIPFGIRGPDGYGSGTGPTLELVEQYEYTDGSPGIIKIGTPENPVYYTNPTDLFKDFDPRMRATVIVPFDEWKGSVIDVQAGIYDQGKKWESGDYTALYNLATHKPDNANGTLHIVGLSGFGTVGSEKSASGFYVKKYMDPSLERSRVRTLGSSQPWVELRYAEVLLNYAEAAMELGNVAEARDKVNLIRARAGIVTLKDADVTIEKVRHERLVELAFENHRWWDYRRWRLSDKLFNNTKPTALKPYYDVDKKAYRFERSVSISYKTFGVEVYYERIDPAELAKNPKLVQNPNY